MNKYHRYQIGFTLIEALITVALLSVLLGVGIPSLTTLVRDNALVTETNHLIGDLNQARSEALKSSSRVILCRTANPNAVTPSCGGSNNVWETGWLVFEDADGNTTYDSGTDRLIKVGNVASGDVTVRANTAADTMIITANGASGESAVARFAICDSRGAANGREVNVSLVGRAFLRTTPSPICSCTAPPNDPLDASGC